MTEAILALGSNVGDRLANLVAAVDLLAERGATVTRRSSTWDTAPMGPQQPRYLNAVIAVETALAPTDLLAVAKEVERLLGRIPGERWGPRPADVDILFYGDQRIDTPDLTIPHPGIAERAFVLAPLAEVVSGDLPVLNRSARDLLQAIGPADVHRTGPLSLSSAPT